MLRRQLQARSRFVLVCGDAEELLLLRLSLSRSLSLTQVCTLSEDVESGGENTGEQIWGSQGVKTDR